MIIAFGGLVIGASMTLYVLCVAAYTKSTSAAWKIFGLAVSIVIGFWMIGVILTRLSG